MRLAMFRGGPLHETSRWLPNNDPVYPYYTQPPLEELLQASIDVYQRGAAAVPEAQVTLYRYDPKDGFYHWEGRP